MVLCFIADVLTNGTYVRLQLKDGLYLIAVHTNHLGEFFDGVEPPSIDVVEKVIGIAVMLLKEREIGCR